LVEADAHERHDGGPPPRALARERPAASLDLAGRQLGGGARRAGAEIGQTHPVAREAAGFGERDGARHEARREQQTPKGISVPGEVVAERPGTQPGIDADQQQPGGRGPTTSRSAGI